MESTIVLEEPRSVVDKFRNWYKEKVIDTGRAATTEEAIDRNIEIEKKVVKVAGTIATIVLLFCPADGPVGEICTALATPLLVKLVELKGDLTKKILIGGKRKFEADFIKEDGSSSKIEVPEFNLEEITKDFVEVKQSTEAFSNVVEGSKGMSK